MELLCAEVYKSEDFTWPQELLDMKIFRRTHKKTPALLLYLVVSYLIIQTCNSQKDKTSRWDLDGDFENIKNYDGLIVTPERALCSSGNSIDDCEDERDHFVYNMQLRKRQQTHNAAALSSSFTSNKVGKSVRTTPSFITRSSSCSCEMERRFIDLGTLYYPRYVETAVCKPGGCHGVFRCRPKEYKLRVLKQKALEDVDRRDSNSGILPDNLKDFFVSETISVTVACNCSP